MGFAAPVAVAALAFAGYLHGFAPWVAEKPTATAVVWAVSLLHAWHFSSGLSFQKLVTGLKVVLVVGFVLAGFAAGNSQQVRFSPVAFAWHEILNPALAVNLVWVSFAYSGWNASAYLAGEIADPERNLSRSILYGTGIVTVLYVALNAVFMMAAPADELRGVKEVGLVASTYLFGLEGGSMMSGVISLLLISTISSMMLAGPRVIRALFSSVPGLRFFSKYDRSGNPARAIAFQAGLATLLLQVVQFDTLLYYTAFTLSLFTVLTVAGVVVLRLQRGAPETYRAFAYPLSPLVFVVTTLGIGGFFAYHHPLESVAGLSTAALRVRRVPCLGPEPACLKTQNTKPSSPANRATSDRAGP